MVSSDGGEQLKGQLAVAERVVRQLHADLLARHGQNPFPADHITPVDTGLNKFWDQAKAAPAHPARAYQPFSEGLWIGMPEDGVTCTVELRQVEGLEAPKQLSLAPQFNEAQESRWCALETSTFHSPLTAFLEQSIYLDVTAHFDAQDAAALPHTVPIFLRLACKDSTQLDTDPYHIITFPTPREQRCHLEIAPEIRASVDAGGGLESVAVIVILPSSGTYRFHLSHWALSLAKL